MTTPDQRLWRRVAHLEQLVERLEGMVLRQGGVRSTLPLAGRLWRFKLNEGFTDNEAEADLLALDGTDTEKDVKIYDPRGICDSLTTDDEGECIEQLDVLGARRYYPVMSGVGGGNQVAYTTTLIPGRVGAVAGGPIAVQPKKLDTSTPPELVNDGDTVQVYSWVESDSSDPGATGFYIFIEQDSHGTWWFTGEDCPPASELE
jgi:hypothetical protein